MHAYSMQPRCYSSMLYCQFKAIHSRPGLGIRMVDGCIAIGSLWVKGFPIGWFRFSAPRREELQLNQLMGDQSLHMVIKQRIETEMVGRSANEISCVVFCMVLFGKSLDLSSNEASKQGSWADP